VLAAHRGTADAAGDNWEAAVYQKVREEVKVGRGLSINRMVKLAGVNRASYYRFGNQAESALIQTWICEMPFNELRCSGRVMDDGELLLSCGAAGGP
jgi:hypothetical protein